MRSDSVITHWRRKPPDNLALRRRKRVRERVAQRANSGCEYCHCPESHSLSTFALEHILPVGEGGPDEESNLAYSCSGCNSFKAVTVLGTDPQTGDEVLLFHPRNDVFEQHFAWNQEDIALLIGLTPTGRATIERLRLNRAGVVNLRRLLAKAGLHPA